MGSDCRVLVADDQTDVIEALRLLLKAEGYDIETATSPGQALAAVEAKDFDVVVMDLNYSRDTTSGQEGLELLIAHPSHRQPAAGDRDDRLGLGGTGGGGDAAAARPTSSRSRGKTSGC